MLELMREVAAEVINPRFRDLDAEEISEKNPGDLVTVADHEAEELLTKALAAAYPDAVVLGEEAYAADPGLLTRYSAAEHAFTVDPVDGTKNFVSGSKDHAVMIGETLRGEVVRAWIYQPQHEKGYVAERGAGAWRDGVRLTRPPVGDPPRVVTSRRRWVGRRLGDLPPLELTWVCCGVDYPKLVEGAADALIYGRGNPWDHVPGSLLLSEAGGWLGTVGGEAYDPRTVAPGWSRPVTGRRTTWSRGGCPTRPADAAPASAVAGDRDRPVAEADHVAGHERRRATGAQLARQPCRTRIEPLVEPRSMTTSSPPGASWNWAWVFESDMSADCSGTRLWTVSPGRGSGRRPTSTTPSTTSDEPSSKVTRQGACAAASRVRVGSTAAGSGAGSAGA